MGSSPHLLVADSKQDQRNNSMGSRNTLTAAAFAFFSTF
jgi:hypothetical protein